MAQIPKRKCVLMLHFCLIVCQVEGHENVNDISNVIGGHATQKIEDLFQEYFEWKWSTVPEAASSKGLYDLLNGDELNDMSLTAIKNIPKQCQKFNNRAQEMLDSFKINPRTKHFLNVLKYETKSCVRGFEQEGYLLAPISFMDGVHIKLTKLFKGNNMKQAGDNP